MIAWKVVDRKLTSFTIDGVGEVRYTKGRVIKPKRECGPLCCFRTLRAAREWCSMVDDFRIFKVKIKKSKSLHVWTTGWDRKLIDYLPWYTVLADTVEVIGEVEL